MGHSECCIRFWCLQLTGARSKPCQIGWGWHIELCITPPALQMPCFSCFSNSCLNTILADSTRSGYAPNSQPLWKSCPAQLQLPKQAHLHTPCCLLTEKPYLSPFPVVLVGTWERTWANTPPLHVFASLPQLVVSSTTLVINCFSSTVEEGRQQCRCQTHEVT